MILLDLPLDNLQNFLLILIRVGAILFTIPFLEARNIPATVKAGLALAVTFMLLPHIQLPAVSIFDSPLNLVVGIVGELVIGAMIGLAVQLIFTGVQLAGQMAGFQMGFAIANVMDPASSLQIPLLSQFLNLFALMIFFSINAHYYFIRALVESFSLVPPLAVHFNEGLMTLLMKMMTDVFLISVKVGAPVMISLLLSNVALGLAARTVPQMQIFIVAMPLKILLGLFFLGLSLPFVGVYLQGLFEGLGRTLLQLIFLFR